MHSLATSLSEKGHALLAIDKDPERLQEIRDMASQAVVADATDRKAIEILGVEQMDAVMVCIDSGLSDSILATLNLKEIEVERVLVRAINEAHGRLLFKIEASEVFFPEKDMALSVAERLHNPNLLDYLPFMEDYSIIELATPQRFVGKALWDLALINRYGIQVIAIKELIADRINLIPTGRFVIKDSDIMILLGPNKGLDELREKER
jgi:trk system potassium uptake protein TrkA